MEQTLFICRSVDVYMIPPREGRGHISGNWLVENKIATCRCRVLSIDNDKLEVRLEDVDSGEIFGACPVPRGQRDAAVENAVDSSRNFVLRIVDPASGRHAFLGVNFAERSNAFDFNVALTDFEKRAQREEELKRAAAAGGAPAGGAAGAALPEAAMLYQHQDLSLKEGEHIRVEVKKKESGSSAAAGGFLARLGSAPAAAAPLPGKLVPLAPPPPAAAPAPRPSEAAVAFGAAAVPQQPAAAAAPAPPADLAPKVVASTEEGWATF